MTRLGTDVFSESTDVNSLLATTIPQVNSNTADISVLETETDDNTVAIAAFNSDTLAAWQADLQAQVGDVVTLKERTAGNGGDGIWDVFASGTFPLGRGVVAHSTLPLQLVFRTKSHIKSAQFGGADSASVQAVIDESPDAGTILITGVPSYDESVNYKGMRHDTDDLPFLINSIAIPSGNLNARMVVDNGILYNCGFSANRVEMFTLDDPRNPRFFSSFAVSSQPRHIAVVGKFVIVCCHGASVIEFYDVDAVASGNLIGTIPTATNPKMFELEGNTLYIPCAGSPFKLQKYTFQLPTDTEPFSFKLEAEASTGNTPLCCALNHAGLIAVTGLGDLVNLYGAKNLNSINDTTIGGAGHGTCIWKTKTQLLISDSTLNQVHSVDYTAVGAPVISDSIDVVSNPEQITIIGDRFYIPQLETIGGVSKLSAVDMVDARNLFEYKQVELSVTDAGFTAYYDNGGENGYLYVNGHAAPFNIDVVEVVKGELIGNQRGFLDSTYTEIAAFGSADISSLSVNSLSATVDSISHKYDTKLSNYTFTIDDNIIRVGAGAAITLLDPELTPGKEISIFNVNASGTSAIINAFLGFSGTLGATSTITLVSMDFSGTFQWDAKSSFGTIT